WTGSLAAYSKVTRRRSFRALSRREMWYDGLTGNGTFSVSIIPPYHPDGGKAHGCADGHRKAPRNHPLQAGTGSAGGAGQADPGAAFGSERQQPAFAGICHRRKQGDAAGAGRNDPLHAMAQGSGGRSEEHTSELQSRENL